MPHPRTGGIRGERTPAPIIQQWLPGSAALTDPASLGASLRRTPRLSSAQRARMPPDPYYRKHLFFCLNQRPEGRACCAAQGAEALQQYAKRRIQALGLSGAGSIRINKAGCLDRCELGPVIVVYPQGVWYTAIDEDDIEEIIQSHLIEDRVVERLVLRDVAREH